MRQSQEFDTPTLLEPGYLLWLHNLLIHITKYRQCTKQYALLKRAIYQKKD